jgi:hypothetical protein
MPDDPQPDETKPVRFVFPRGATAVEIHAALKKMLQERGHLPAGSGGPAVAEGSVEDDGGETRK